METIQPLTLKISNETWQQFKARVPHTRTLNGTIVELIERYNDETV